MKTPEYILSHPKDGKTPTNIYESGKKEMGFCINETDNIEKQKKEIKWKINEDVDISEGAEENEENEENEDFETLLNMIGTTGPWNIMVFVLCNMSSFLNAFQTMTYEFIGATPDYWCKVDELVEANWTQHQIINFAIPLSDNSQPERCQMYDYNYTLAVEMGYELAMETLAPNLQISDKRVFCSSRDFNFTQYTSTLVTDFDLVCERRPLYSTTQAASQLGVLFASLSIGYLNEMFGRRRINMWFVVLFLLASFGCCLSPSLEVYIVLKVLTCTFVFIIYCSSFLTTIELCSSKQRSSVGSLFLIPWAVAYMLVPGFAYLIRPWRWLHAAYTLPGVLFLSYFGLMPESPRWLISEGRYEEALEVFSWAAKMNKKTLPPDQDLMKIMKKIKIIKEEKPKEKFFTAIYKKIEHLLSLVIKYEFRHRAIVCFICWFSVSLVYYGISLGSSTLSTDPYMYMFLGGVIELPSYILLWPSIAYLGRRTSVISQYLICGICISIIAVLMIMIDKVPNAVLLFLSLTGKLAITATFHLLYIYTAELFPTKYRSLAIGESSTMARFGSMISPYITDLFGEKVSWGPSVIYTIFSILAATLALTLPETKNAVMNEEKSFTIKPKDNDSSHLDRGYSKKGYESS